jgi:hypothetical protein
MLCFKLRGSLILVAFCTTIAASAADVNARYPYRLPDWLWDVESNAHLIPADEVVLLRRDIKKYSALAQLDDSSEGDALEKSIASRIASRFAPQDLTGGAYRAKNTAAGIDLAAIVDPSFSPEAQATIRSAVSRYVQVALDDRVIESAIARSIAEPRPFPAKYEIKDEKEVVDAAGRRTFTSAYALYLRSRAQPRSSMQFARQLKLALSAVEEVPAIIIISSYTGNVWWGGAYYRYFNDPVQQLARVAPSRGYLYIRLNADKLVAGESHWNDADFWASKIGHELLHNLAYWHPPYKDVVERNENNVGSESAFIVAYEAALFELLKKKTRK